ncbi:hypothetical protein BT96DRAFT_943352 [Gymnopus androsaceus JB14]|uniref:CxC2-like cysteine cluster KDZ transposase-associated domain-containing protein n=1 Tax=Gymnopus androsaceus JB14 TaxID=1447944 RepID=A0A6A4H8V6_9AGAR|nr:hypothetical protein BT96DRAFT_943352 [Gymnopus androsaceus JB14]
MMRQWRHLKMLLHGGRANNNIRNIEQTAQDELALMCPACPHPNINLPPEWKDPDHPNPFIYMLFIAIDACFRLKWKLISNVVKDPYLQPGMAYLVNPEPYREYLLTMTDQDEMCTCTGLAALDYANTCLSRGYAIMGIGLCCCARHEIIGKNRAAPLQKGERYANIDYAVASFLQHNLPPKVRYRMVLTMVKFVIPKLHIYGHKLLYQLMFSLNLTPGVGRTNTSTREMGPGSHADTLEDHWSHWNWNKIVKLGFLLHRRLLNARKELVEQTDSFAQFTAAQASEAVKWKKEVEEFEEDSSKPNPYELPKSGLGLQDIWAQIAHEDAAEAQRTQALVMQDSEEDWEAVDRNKADVGLSRAEFILAGLEVEEHQRQLQLDITSMRDPMPHQLAQLVENQNQLTQKITQLQSLQAKYCPSALQALAIHPDVLKSAEPLVSEKTPLILPSALPPASAISDLQALESRLHDGQCLDALDQLCNDLQVKSQLHTYKKSNACKQGATTRTRARMDHHERKIKLSTLRYRAAWAAKLNLVGGVKENVGWKELKDADIRTMHDAEDRKQQSKDKLNGSKLHRKEQELKKLQSAKRKRDSGNASSSSEEDLEEGKDRSRGKGYRKLSWIWMAADNTDMAMDGLLHSGGILILEEEMHRTLVFLEWKKNWWESKAVVEAFKGAHAAGASAYAYEQAEVWRSLGLSFLELWARHDDGTFIIPPKTRGGQLSAANRTSAQARCQAVISTYVESDSGSDDGSNEEELELVGEEVNVNEGMEESVGGELASGNGDKGEGAEGTEAGEGEEDLDLDLEALVVAGKYSECRVAAGTIWHLTDGAQAPNRVKVRGAQEAPGGPGADFGLA